MTVASGAQYVCLRSWLLVILRLRYSCQFDKNTDLINVKGHLIKFDGQHLHSQGSKEMIRKISSLFTTVAFTLPIGDSFLVFQSKIAGGVPRQVVLRTTNTCSGSRRMAGSDVDEDKFDYSEDEIKNYVSKLPPSLQESVSQLLMPDRKRLKQRPPMKNLGHRSLRNLRSLLPSNSAFTTSQFIAVEKETTVPTTEKKPLETLMPKISSFRVSKTKKAVLALDGGGVRGLITTYVLQVLEEELQKQTGIKDLLIGEAFDIVAGTSTGSILAAYLTAYCGLAEKNITIPSTEKWWNSFLKKEKPKPRVVVLNGTVASAREMYQLFAQKVFKKPSKLWDHLLSGMLNVPAHNDEDFNQLLKDVFGHLTLNWLATSTENRFNFKNETGNESIAEVASLLIPAYDLTYHRPIAFMADRHFKCAHILGIDPYSGPFMGGGFGARCGPEGVKEASERYNLVKEAHTEYTAKHHVPFSLENLAEAQLPINETLPEQFIRYRKSLDTNLNINLSDVIRCSTAAPGFLAPGRIENFFENVNQHDADRRHLDCCDGGVVANSPALTAFSTQYFQQCKMYDGINKVALFDALGTSKFPNHMVLSIGCGQTAKEVHPDNVPKGLISYILGTGNLFDVLMSSNSQLSHAHTEALFAAGDAWENYLRIQLSVNKPARGDKSPGSINNETIFDKLSNMDDALPETIKIYEEIGMYLASVYKPLIKKFVQRMLASD